MVREDPRTTPATARDLEMGNGTGVCIKIYYNIYVAILYDYHVSISFSWIIPCEEARDNHY